MNILVYFPYNLRTVEQQSVMEMLVQKGHKVVLLTTGKRGYLHEYVERSGVIAEAADADEAEGKISFYRKNLKKLGEVISKYKIDMVIAHQQITALIAGMLRLTRKFKLVYVRHNSDEDYGLNARKAKWQNRIVNVLTPVKVAPSTVVEEFWKRHEKVAAKNITRVNYGYNFNQYEKPDEMEVSRIRAAFPTQLRIVSMARLVPAKRHDKMFAVIKRLVDTGVDCKLLCLGSGVLEGALSNLITHLAMEQHIFLLGRKDNVFDYLEAADVFLHLSSTEASNSAVKEAGLCKKTVIVCKGVGDFEDYIINGKNGFLVDKEAPEDETFSIFTDIASGRIDKQLIGAELFQTVHAIFDIDRAAIQYEALIKQVMKN